MDTCPVLKSTDDNLDMGPQERVYAALRPAYPPCTYVGGRDLFLFIDVEIVSYYHDHPAKLFIMFIRRSILIINYI